MCVGSWLCDYLFTTIHVDPITIVDKREKPGYYKDDCPSGEEDRRRRCPQVWVPPEWLVIYSDGAGRREMSVERDGYDRLSRGDRLWIWYQRGSVWGGRYGERILSQPPSPEAGR